MTALRPVDAQFVAQLRERGTAPSEATVTSMALVAEAGITYRMLDYWSRTGRLRPATMVKGKHAPVVADITDGGSGWQRRYPAAEVKVAALMKRLLDVGICLPVAHDAARAHVEDPDEIVVLGPGLALIIEDES